MCVQQHVTYSGIHYIMFTLSIKTIKQARLYKSLTELHIAENNIIINFVCQFSQNLILNLVIMLFCF